MNVQTDFKQNTINEHTFDNNYFADILITVVYRLFFYYTSYAFFPQIYRVFRFMPFAVFRSNNLDIKAHLKTLIIYYFYT